MEKSETSDDELNYMKNLMLENCVRELFMAEKNTWVDLKWLNLTTTGIRVREILENSNYVEFQSGFRLNRFAKLTDLGYQRIDDIVPIPYKRYISK
jgi:hypothetical protein